MLNENLLQQYEQACQHHSINDKPWLAALRKQSWNDLLVQGLPTSRDEHWKYTNLSSLNNQQFNFVAKNGDQDCQELYLTGQHYRLVFVDGVFDKAASILPENEKYIVTNLATAMQRHEDLVREYLSKTQNKPAFMNLNTACLQDGVFICAPLNCIVKKPIHIICVTSSESENNLQNMRNVVVAEPGSNLTIIEEHKSFCNKIYLANIVTELHADQDSKIEFCKLQVQNTSSYHVGNIEISQKKNSQVLVHHYSLGGQLVRDDIHCYLNEPYSSVMMQGLYLPLKKQHIDLHTYIYHRSDYTSSEELFKGVVASKSTAVFNGKIHESINRHFLQD